MEWNKVLFLIPYLLALAITTSVFFYAWRHRRVRGGSAYTWYVAGQLLWSIGYILELLASTISGKVFWDSFQWIAGFIILIAFPIFAAQYADFKPQRAWLIWGATSIVLVIMTILVLTDGQHHLIYPNPHLVYNAAFPELDYDFTWAVYGYAIYSYLVTFTGMGLLIWRMVRPHRLYRRQIFTVALGFFIPVAFTILTTAGVKFTPYRDVSILTFALGNLIIAWGLFRYKLFEVVPIARDLVVENMEDLVVVLDMQDRVVDINSAALEAMNMNSSQVIGQPAEAVFNQWPALVEKFYRPENIKMEISLSTSDVTIHYEIKSTILHDKNKRYIGRVFVSRDITERVNLQKSLEELNKELEERVLERTEELLESAERYRAVVENQTEFIVRWKPDRTRTFVNDAYCRFFGLTPEQALRTDFLSLIVEEDRQAVEEKISRLISGVTDVETEIHRVIQPDGSIGWQEWTDQAIRDETGQVIEFQSVGRDVTERKQAEEALRESEERFAILSTATFEAIGLSEQGKIIDVNEQMLEMFGYTRSEMIGMNVEQLVAPEAIELVIRNISLGLEQAYEHLAVKKDGTLFPVEVRPRTIPYKGRTVRVTAISDITERKKAEARILRLNRLYATISQINQTIVHARDRSSLFSEICRVAIDHGQFRMAWIGLLDETDELIKPIIFAGEEQGYLSNLEITFRDEIMGWGPTGTAVREGRCVICQDIDSDPRMIPWREHALKHGYRSSAAVPFREQGQVVGALTVYAGEPQGFDSEDEGLLEQIGRNLSFALDSIDADVERKRAEENLAEAYDTTLEGWAKALELRDKETEGHSRRVTETTLIVARAMGFKEEELVDIRRGSILHDIGKMGIPDEILRKKGRLTNEERTIVEKHPNTAFDLLKQIPYLKKSLEIPYCHHEKWDGTGYPRGLKGDEIPLSARIFAIVDVWDALSSDRPYREAWSQDNVTQYLLNESGKHFDPNIVEVFLQLLREGKI